MRQARVGIALSALLLVALANPPSSAQDAEDESRTVDVETVEVDEPYRLLYPLRKTRPAVANPAVVEVALDDETRLRFVDVDGNGRFADRDVDGWTRTGDEYRYIVPVGRTIVVDAQLIQFEFSDDGKTFTYRAETFVPVEREGERLQKPRNIKRRKPSKILAALVQWNDLRLRNGLVPGALDNELSDGCHKHAFYCAHHGITHTEIATKPHYTPEGEEAGRWSGIGSEDPPTEVDHSYRSLFHRIQLVHATTERIGIGYARGVTVLDGSRARGRRKWNYPVCIPAPGTDSHPRSCAPERPVPHENVFGDYRGLEGAGCPITLTFVHDDITDVRAELREGGPDGKQVDALVSWPEQPASPSIPDNYKTIGIMPRKTLRSRKRYWVHVEFVYQGRADSRTWEFTTAK